MGVECIHVNGGRVISVECEGYESFGALGSFGTGNKVSERGN